MTEQFDSLYVAQTFLSVGTLSHILADLPDPMPLRSGNTCHYVLVTPATTFGNTCHQSPS